jgi:hypothetical protein
MPAKRRLSPFLTRGHRRLSVAEAANPRMASGFAAQGVCRGMSAAGERRHTNAEQGGRF